MISTPHPLLQNPLPRSLQGLSGALGAVYDEIGSIQKRLGTSSEQPSDFKTLYDLVHRYNNALTGYGALKTLGLSEAPGKSADAVSLTQGVTQGGCNRCSYYPPHFPVLVPQFRYYDSFSF